MKKQSMIYNNSIVSLCRYLSKSTIYTKTHPINTRIIQPFPLTSDNKGFAALGHNCVYDTMDLTLFMNWEPSAETKKIYYDLGFTFYSYISYLCKHYYNETELIMAIILLDRLINNTNGKFILTADNYYMTFTTLYVIIQKYHSIDIPYKNRYWSKKFLIPLSVLNTSEIYVLENLDYKLYISEEEFESGQVLFNNIRNHWVIRLIKPIKPVVTLTEIGTQTDKIVEDDMISDEIVFGIDVDDYRFNKKTDFGTVTYNIYSKGTQISTKYVQRTSLTKPISCYEVIKIISTGDTLLDIPSIDEPLIIKKSIEDNKSFDKSIDEPLISKKSIDEPLISKKSIDESTKNKLIGETINESNNTYDVSNMSAKNVKIDFNNIFVEVPKIVQKQIYKQLVPVDFD